VTAEEGDSAVRGPLTRRFVVSNYLLIFESPGNVQSDHDKVISMENVSRLDHGQITAATLFGRCRSSRRVERNVTAGLPLRPGELNHNDLVTWDTPNLIDSSRNPGQIAQNCPPTGLFGTHSRKGSLLGFSERLSSNRLVVQGI
jgi:hypothetical protein